MAIAALPPVGAGHARDRGPEVRVVARMAGSYT